MRLLLDINILLDVVLGREPWDIPAARLLAALERHQVSGLVAGSTLPTVHYVVTRARDRATADAAITDLLRIVEVIPVEKADFRKGSLRTIRPETLLSLL